MFVEGDINFKFDDDYNDSVDEQAYSMNPSQQSYGSSNSRYNWGFEYKIVPLVHNLSQKGNDSELQKHNIKLYGDDINIFDVVTGKAFIDSEEHTGYVTYISYKDGGLTPKYIWILDSKDKKKYALYPKSCKVHQTSNGYTKQRVNPFVVNTMHLHEGRDIFADEELKYSDEAEQEAYRLACLEKLDIDEKYVNGFDDIILYKKYTQKYIDLHLFDAYFFIKCLGIDRDVKSVVLKCMKLFIKNYCNLTEQPYDKNVKLQYNSGSQTWIKKWQPDSYTNCLKVSSWKDVYMMYIAFMYTYNEVRHSVDYMPRRGNSKDEVSFSPRHKDFKKSVSMFICKSLAWTRQYYDDETQKIVTVFE